MNTDLSLSSNKVVGCILAGGLSRRMGGGDKWLKTLGDTSLLDLVIDRLSGQTGTIVLNANGNPDRLERYGLPVIADAIEGFAGPLAGISACMNWAAEHTPEATHIVTVAADTPFFPVDLLSRFQKVLEQESCEIAMAKSDGHRHPVFGLWSLALRDNLAQWMKETDTYKVIAWARLHRLSMVDFPMIDGRSGTIDPFFNVNTAEDLLTAEQSFGDLGTLTNPRKEQI